MTRAQSEARLSYWAQHRLERENSVLWAIQHLTAKHGYPPTVREVGWLCGFSSTDNVHYWLNILRDEGKVTWAPGQARTLRLT